MEEGEGLRPEAAEPSEPPKPEEALIDKVYNYLVERGKASPLQIAKDLSMKSSTVMQILIELKRRDKVKRVV